MISLYKKWKKHIYIALIFASVLQLIGILSIKYGSEEESVKLFVSKNEFIARSIGDVVDITTFQFTKVNASENANGYQIFKMKVVGSISKAIVVVRYENVKGKNNFSIESIEKL